MKHSILSVCILSLSMISCAHQGTEANQSNKPIAKQLRNSVFGRMLGANDPYSPYQPTTVSSSQERATSSNTTNQSSNLSRSQGQPNSTIATSYTSNQYEEAVVEVYEEPIYVPDHRLHREPAYCPPPSHHNHSNYHSSPRHRPSKSQKDLIRQQLKNAYKK